MLYRIRLVGLLVVFLGNVQILYADPLHDMFAKTLLEAEEGRATSMYDLARMYQLGVGTERSVKEAMVWYQQAALKGNARAAFKMGEIYYEGAGVPTDFAAAHKWFLTAAEGGSKEARAPLSTMYLEGQGVKQDLVKAEKWSKPPEKTKKIEQEKVATQTKEEASEKNDAVKVKEKPKTTMETVTEAKWNKGKKPALYLPSSASHCHQEKKAVVCMSDELHGQQLNLTYTYRVMSRLSRFTKKGNFEVAYKFQLGDVVEGDPEGYATEDDEVAMKATAGSILDELKKKESQLSCSLIKNKTMICRNARGKSLTFNAAR